MLSTTSLIILAVITMTNGAPSTPQDCDMRMYQMDESMKIALIITNKNQRLDLNEDGLTTEYCLPMKDHIKTIGNYKPCLKSFPKQLFSMVLSNAKKNTKAICGTSKQRRTMLNNMKCFTPETFPELNQLGYGITTLLDHLANMSDINDVIPGLCCGYQMIINDAREKLERVCSSQGVGQSGPDYFIGLVQAAMSDAIDMMCGAYSNMDQCTKKKPMMVEELRTLQSANTNVEYNYTMVVPFLKLIDRIDSETNLDE